LADQIFEEDVFAQLYDHFNAWGASDDFYLGLARERGGSALDVGCGTGMLACRIAEEGLSVVAVDPAAGMLRLARARPGGGKVRWIASKGQDLRLSERFDLAYMTGHAFQALLSDEDAIDLLAAIARHLAPGGRFAFETRNPARRAWESWSPGLSNRVAETCEHGRVEEMTEAFAEQATGIVALRHRYRFLDQGTELTGWSRIRFVERPHVFRLLAEACLRPIACYGDWDRRPFAPDSPEIVVLSEAAA
jgi:SAM-dependent methyltransferase